MPEFSTQYAKKYLGEEGDFDIYKEAKKLKKGEYVSLICEGYGFVAVGKNENKEIKLAIPINDKEVEWVDLSYFNIKPKENFWKKLIKF